MCAYRHSSSTTQIILNSTLDVYFEMLIIRLESSDRNNLCHKPYAHSNWGEYFNSNNWDAAENQAEIKCCFCIRNK